MAAYIKDTRANTGYNSMISLKSHQYGSLWRDKPAKLSKSTMFMDLETFLYTPKKKNLLKKKHKEQNFKIYRKFKEQIKLNSLHSEIITINTSFLFHTHRNTQRCYVYKERERGRERIILDSEKSAL